MNGWIYGYLSVFHAISEQGGIAAAARKLKIAPPSVSQSLRSVERHIGLPLFNRTTPKMELTEASLRLLESTDQLMRSLEYAVESVQDLGAEPPCPALPINWL